MAETLTAEPEVGTAIQRNPAEVPNRVSIVRKDRDLDRLLADRDSLKAAFRAAKFKQIDAANLIGLHPNTFHQILSGALATHPRFSADYLSKMTELRRVWIEAMIEVLDHDEDWWEQAWEDCFSDVKRTAEKIGITYMAFRRVINGEAGFVPEQIVKTINDARVAADAALSGKAVAIQTDLATDKDHAKEDPRCLLQTTRVGGFSAEHDLRDRRNENSAGAFNQFNLLVPIPIGPSSALMAALESRYGGDSGKGDGGGTRAIGSGNAEAGGSERLVLDVGVPDAKPARRKASKAASRMAALPDAEKKPAAKRERVGLPNLLP